MSDAVAMLAEAANQGHMLAQATIADLFLNGVGALLACGRPIHTNT
jgi:TPR repeat protein